MKHWNSATTAFIPGIITFSIFTVLTAKSGAAQTRVSLQPFAQHVRQVETSLAYLGQPLDQRITRRSTRPSLSPMRLPRLRAWSRSSTSTPC